MAKTLERWTTWRAFPDPRKNEFLIAPYGAGCYQLRIKGNNKLVLFGMGGHVASRMTTLLPSPLGSGTRNNIKKRNYVCKNIRIIQYRTIACTTWKEAKKEEDKLRTNRNDYLFPT